jgi:DNA-binding response OmpR family regulator
MQGTQNILVLVVEDDEPIRELLVKVLTDGHFKVLAVQNAEDALQKAQTEKPDILVLDLLLPTMSGIEMLKKLRESEWGKGTPVIVLSNFSDEKTITEVTNMGNSKFLLKASLRLKNLIPEIMQMVQNTQQPGTAET